MSGSLNQVMSFNDFTKKGDNKDTKTIPAKPGNAATFKTFAKNDALKKDPKAALVNTKSIDPTKPKKPVIENINTNYKALTRISKRQLVDILNFMFSDREPKFTLEDVSWDFVTVFNKEASLLIAKNDLLDPNYYNSPSDSLNTLRGILEELADRFDIELFLHKEEFVDDTATSNFYIDEEPASFTTNESALLVEDNYNVKTTFDVPASLLEEFKNKVQEETSQDANATFSDTELAEQLVVFVLNKYLVIDNLPSSIAVGETSDVDTQAAADKEAEKIVKTDGSINVNTKNEGFGLMGLDEFKIEMVD